jgi:hypothetical protein
VGCCLTCVSWGWFQGVEQVICSPWGIPCVPGDCSPSCWYVWQVLCLSGGLALAQVLFFYVKYLVLFGVPALLMRLDGLKPPPLPRCVSTMFSFTGMWRSVAWFIKVPWDVQWEAAWCVCLQRTWPSSSFWPSLKPHLAFQFLYPLNRMTTHSSWTS